MTDGGRRGDSKYQRCPPSCGLATVNRRGVPTPIGTLRYFAVEGSLSGAYLPHKANRAGENAEAVIHRTP